MVGDCVPRRTLLIAIFAWSLAWSATGPQSPAYAAAGESQKTALDEAFRIPPDEAKPWAYWWWLKGNVSEGSITRDLEAMKRMGFAGLLMFDARGYHEDHVPPPESRMDFMGPEWRRMLKFAISEADRLGLQTSVNLSSCAGALKGPWLVGNDAPKQLLWTSLETRGGRTLRCRLPRPEAARSWGVALVAVRHAESNPAAAAAEGAATEKNASWGGWQTVQGQPDPKRLAAEVVDLSGKIDAQGQLAWDVPEGRWRLIRFACATMEGHEYDVDILDENAVAGHFERIGRVLIDDAGPLAGKTLTHFYSVSWEGAIPTWTVGFDEMFFRHRGYRIGPFLPVLAGITVETPEVSARFLRDYDKVLGDCFRDNFYGKLKALSNREGIKWHSESGGPWNRNLSTFRHADQLAFLARNDMPQGEFWYPYRGLNKPPAMTAHIYGLPLAATEAFTHMQTHWSVYPAVLKPCADAAFCDGVNHFIWHTFSASPPEFGKPGIEYFAGTHINPNVTWSAQSGAFLAYLARCQLLLRQGHFTADVCCYTGDHAYLNWGRGETWVPGASLRLGKGYSYDLVNTEVLLSRLSVDRGDLVLPGGMRYRVLAVDLESDAMDAAALAKIVELAESGATLVLGNRRPVRAPGLDDYPQCDERVRRLAARLWGGTEPSEKRRSLGQGEVFCDTPIDEALRAKGIERDFEGPWDYLHRRGENLDVYFVAGSGQADCTFRVSGREPELWDPATGRIRDAVCYRPGNDGRTTVPLRLPENGSVFVVFRAPCKGDRLLSASGPDDGLEIEGRGERGYRLSLWKQGRYELASPKGQIALDVDDLPPPRQIAGPWTVRFTPGWGAPESSVFEKLIPWNEHPLEGIRFFSGSGTYRTTFELGDAEAASLVKLHLGQVGNIATVRVNGRDLGAVWTAPWSIDLTGCVSAGRNELEIEVANLWVNRLVGDSRLPPEKRLTRTNVRLFGPGEKFRAYQGFSPETPLTPSGLIGPVTLQFGRSVVQSSPSRGG